MNDRPFGDRHGPTPDEMRHRFTARPVDPELERAATERAVQAAEESARAAAWIDAHSGPATSGNAPTLNNPGEKFTPGVKGSEGLRDRVDNAIGQALDDDPMHTLTDLQQRLTTTVCAALRPELDALAALRQVARGYCPRCGRGDAAPTVDDWEQQKGRADRAEAELRHYTEAESADAAAGSYAHRAEHAEAALERVRRLADGWVKAGPPPLGTSMARWWDKRLIELLAALDQPAAGPAATQATDERCSLDASETEPNTWTEPAHDRPCTATIEGRATPGGRQVQCTREAGHPENHVGPKQGSNGRVLWTDSNAGAVPHRRG
jgi:hypothetical protein